MKQFEHPPKLSLLKKSGQDAVYQIKIFKIGDALSTEKGGTSHKKQHPLM